MIKLATSIVSGEYDKKWGVAEEEKVTVAVKKTGRKKVVKKTLRKAGRKK